jgi:hypothetical protein
MSNPIASFRFAMGYRLSGSATLASVTLENPLSFFQAHAKCEDDFALRVEPAVESGLDAIDRESRDSGAPRQLGFAEELGFAQPLQVISGLSQRHGPPSLR